MRVKPVTNVLGIAIVLIASLVAQTPPAAQTKKATYIANEEVQAFLARVEGRPVIDQQMRAVDVGKTNVAVGVVYRGKLAAPAKQSVAEHDHVSEVYHIIDGTATLVTGADIEDLQPRPASDRAVRLINGPGGNGASIRNGVTYHLKAGDVVIIPAGVGHLFTRIDDHIRYLMVRVDPDRVAPLKDEAAAKEDLRSGGVGN